MLNYSIFEKINKHYPKIKGYNFIGQIWHGDQRKILKKVEFALDVYRNETVPKDPTICLYFYELVLRTHLPLLEYLIYMSFVEKGFVWGKYRNETAQQAVDDFFSVKNKEWFILIDEIFADININTCNILELIGKTLPLFEAPPYESYFAELSPKIRGERGERFSKTVYRSFRLQTCVTFLKAMYKRMLKKKNTNPQDDVSALDEFFDEFFLIAKCRLMCIARFA